MPGIKRVRMMNSRDLARELCPAVLKDLSIAEGERVAVLVNGLGMTSREELFIFYKDVAEYLEEKGIGFDVGVTKVPLLWKWQGCLYRLCGWMRKWKPI